MRASVVFVFSVVLLAGCGSDVAAAQASDVAVAFARAAPPQACALLAPDTEDAVAKHAGRPCPEAMAALHLPTASDVRQVEVDGEGAQVRVGGQVVFLSHFPDGWRVTAAGCVRDDPDPATPYDCDVER